MDIITGGSPCQDLSVAGKRAGLDGERSGLFMEQIRIVKEMRERDRRTGRTGWLIRPRFMVWENVPGAFSSNKGKDFQAVLTEIVQIAEPDASDVPMPETGRWSKSGCLYSDVGNWSIAWRVHDAQFWGVPQRRKRIALVADFGGLAAPEILFERKSLSGYSEPGEAEREGTADSSADCSGEPSFCLTGWDCQGISFHQNQEGEIHTSKIAYTVATTSNASARQTALAMVSVFENHSQDSRYKPLGEVSETVNAKYGTGGNNQPLVVEPTIYNGENVTSPQNKANPQPGDPCHTLGTDTRNYVTSLNHIVRRLTPLECERLQGYPDGWTDIGEWIDSKGKKHKEADSPRYKALGNSIALPFWAWMARRICAQYERPMTMGSLFDGIGGFPLVFERAGAKAVWASEIEEFPIAVTKRHFQEEDT